MKVLQGRRSSSFRTLFIYICREAAFSFFVAFRDAMNNELAEFTLVASMMLFGGAALIIGYYLDKPKK